MEHIKVFRNILGGGKINLEKEEEIAFIEKMIRSMDLNNNSTEEELELSEGEEDGSENE